MKKRFAIAGTAVLAVGLSTFINAQPASAATGIHVSGTSIVEANGNKFVMRGTSHAHTWYSSQTKSFKDIKSLGANTVRVVLSGGRWTANGASDVANVVSLCKTNKLICVLEDHDTTGYGEQSGAYTLAQAVSYWQSLKSVLQGQENYIIINIGNEPYGNNNPADWTSATVNAVKAMRSAGFQHSLMVDAPSWGQDWAGVMRDNATTVAAADPQKNVIFSVHMYGVYDTAAEITSYLSAFKSKGLPLVIGEFGHNHSDGNPDEDTIMATAQSQGVGYLGWSWSGNSSDVGYLDQVNSFNVASLTSWGQRLFNGANGIKATAKQATIYGGQPNNEESSSPTEEPTTPPDSGQTGGCSAAYAITGSWQDGFQTDVKVTAGSAAISGWTVTWTLADGQSVKSSWNATVSTSGSSVTAQNLSYNGQLAAGTSAAFGFVGSFSGGNPVPTLTCVAS
jgi:mannan endo-1,4-beta-mannosidase